MFRAQPGEFTPHQAVALLRARLHEIGSTNETLYFGINACEEALGGMALNTSGNSRGVLLRRGYLEHNDSVYGFQTTEKGRAWVLEAVAVSFIFRWLRQLPLKPVRVPYDGACSPSCTSSS